MRPCCGCNGHAVPLACPSFVSTMVALAPLMLGGRHQSRLRLGHAPSGNEILLRARASRGSASGARQSRFCLGRAPIEVCLGCAPIEAPPRARSSRDLALGAVCMMPLLCTNDSLVAFVLFGASRGSASGACQLGRCLGREAIEALLRVQWTCCPSRRSLFCVDNDGVCATHAGCSAPIEVVLGARAKRKRGSASGARQSRLCLRRQSALGTRPARLCLGRAPIRGSASGARQSRLCLGCGPVRALLGAGGN